MKNAFVIVFVTALLSGCITAKDMAAMIEAGGKDNATLCAELIGGVAGMSITAAAPVVIPGAGYYGKGVFCRTNQPGSTIKQNADGSLEIWHGAAVDKDLSDRVATLESAVKYLIQKLLEKISASKGKEF